MVVAEVMGVHNVTIDNIETFSTDLVLRRVVGVVLICALAYTSTPW